MDRPTESVVSGRLSTRYIFENPDFPEVGQKQLTEKKERKKKDRKLVITMASYALQKSPWVAHTKPPGPIY